MYKLGVNNNKDIMVMKVVMDDMPPALKLKKVKEEAEDDPTYQELKRTIQAGKKSKNSDLSLYAHLLKELTVVGKLVLRGERIVVPNSVPGEGNGTLRQGCLKLGYEGHQAAPPHKVAGPGMERHAETRVASCLQCQASTPTYHRDPLQPTTVASKSMEHLKVTTGALPQTMSTSWYSSISSQGTQR